MLKRITIPAAAIMAVIGYPVHAQVITVPTTAASFPASAIPATAGTIDFWAKFTGYSGEIQPSGYSPHLVLYEHEPLVYAVAFTPNSGLGGTGLVGYAGSQFHAGSGGSTYEDVLGAGGTDTWHHYTLKWDQDGLADVPGQKVAVYLDGALNSTHWAQSSSGTFPALLSGTLNLIAGIATGEERIAIDEFKIFDGNNNLVLYNTLDSINDVTHSAIGLNGSFNGFGNPTFVPGILGNALEATPVYLLAPIPEPETYAMMLAGLGLIGFIARRRKIA